MNDRATLKLALTSQYLLCSITQSNAIVHGTAGILVHQTVKWELVQLVLITLKIWE